MVDHVRPLGIVSLVRALLEGALGIHLVLVADVWSREAGWFGLRGIPEDGDRQVFVIFGVVLLAFSTARLAQSICSLFVLEWSRKAGLLLAIFDFATPISLPMAFWSLVVYLHSDTRDHFRGYRDLSPSPRSQAS